MKRAITSILILAVLSFWIPRASAEISQDLDPMVSPDAQATVTDESLVGNRDAAQTSHGVSTADTAAVEKKLEEPKKEKSKKSSKKKSSEKKSEKKKKSESRSSKKHKKSSN